MCHLEGVGLPAQLCRVQVSLQANSSDTLSSQIKDEGGNVSVASTWKTIHIHAFINEQSYHCKPNERLNEQIQRTK